MFIPFITALMLAIVICFLLVLYFFPIISERTYAFRDIIIESIARSGHDKAAELSLFWILLALGILLMLLVLIAGCFVRKKEEKPEKSAPGRLPFYALIPIFPFMTHLSVYGECNLLLLLGFLYSVLIFLIRKKVSLKPAEALLLPVLIYYTTVGFLTLCCFFTDKLHLRTSTPLYLITAVLTAALLAIGQKQRKTAMLAMQCVIPLVLSVNLTDTYLYQGKLIRVRYAPFYYAFFLLLILTLIAMAARHFFLCRSRLTELSYSKLVNVATAVTVFIYHSFSAAPLYAQPDQHHHGEQMIPWQQIVTLSRSAYEEYTPVSGLFPMVNGFIQNILMRGTVSDYSPAISVTMVIFCTITIVLVYLHTDGATALLFAVFFALPSYNRQYMVLPALLLLFLPKLREKTALWLITWIYTCLFAGLYYPLYGVAVALGTLPLGFSVLNRLRHQMDWSEEHKKTLPLTRCTLCLLPVLLFVPLLMRMAAHTLTYSAQSQAADGISLIGQQPPDYFLPYLASAHASARQWLYLSYRFLLPMLGVWLFALLPMLTWKRSRQLCFALVAGILALCVSYTYTLVRADTGMILSRTAPILISVCGMFLPVMLLSYKKQGRLAMDSRVLMLVAGICFSLPSMVYQKTAHMKFPDMWIYPDGNSALVMDDAAKLYHHYEVPDLLVKMDSIPLHDKSMLGNGFMVRDQIDYLIRYESVMNKCENAMEEHAAAENYVCNLSYMGLDGQGFYYYLNAKACSTGFIQAGKGYQAQQKILERVKKERPVVFLIEPQCSYYVFVWMMENNYVYVAGDDAFYPLELYCLVYDKEYTTATLEAPEAQNTAEGNHALLANGMLLGDDLRLSCPQTDFGYVASSFGASYETLRPLFEGEKKLQLFSNNEGIAGIEYDFMYLTWKEGGFNALTRDWQNAGGSLDAPVITIRFTCDTKQYEGAAVSFALTGRDLLLPMGMNACWLLSRNEGLTVSVSDPADSAGALLTMPLDEFAGKYLADVTFCKLSRER